MLINLDTGQVLIRRLHIANTFRRRLLGLLPCRGLEAGEGMLLTPCRSVHTFFMRFTIEVLYLDKQLQVVAAFSNVGPWRVLPAAREVCHVLEMAPGTLTASGTAVGHRLKFVGRGALADAGCGRTPFTDARGAHGDG